MTLCLMLHVSVGLCTHVVVLGGLDSITDYVQMGIAYDTIVFRSVMEFLTPNALVTCSMLQDKLQRVSELITVCSHVADYASDEDTLYIMLCAG